MLINVLLKDVFNHPNKKKLLKANFIVYWFFKIDLYRLKAKGTTLHKKIFIISLSHTIIHENYVEVLCEFSSYISVMHSDSFNLGLLWVGYLKLSSSLCNSKSIMSICTLYLFVLYFSFIFWSLESKSEIYISQSVYCISCLSSFPSVVSLVHFNQLFWSYMYVYKLHIILIIKLEQCTFPEYTFHPISVASYGM